MMGLYAVTVHDRGCYDGGGYTTLFLWAETIEDAWEQGEAMCMGDVMIVAEVPVAYVARRERNDLLQV